MSSDHGKHGTQTALQGLRAVRRCQAPRQGKDKIMISEPQPAPVVAAALDDIEDRGRLGAGIRAMAGRRGMFSGALEMRLVGAAMVPDARRMLSDRLTEGWARVSGDRDGLAGLNMSDKEVIIGAGFTAAVYASVRVALGFPKPVVLEQGDAAHVGGAFAVSTEPVFWLNSGNRPGPPGLPGNPGRSLNYLPGAPVQVASITGAEYPTNADMAWVVRVALAQNAAVYPSYVVTDVDAISDTMSVNGVRMAYGRLVDARGLGSQGMGDGPNIITSDQLMSRMGSETFPLAGLGRVAVVGDGDSARCAVEALLGIGPSRGMSMASADFVPSIDWYGPSLAVSCKSWRQSERGRYQAISKYLRPNFAGSEGRVRILPQRGRVTRSLGCALVNGEVYETVVMATGYSLASDYDTYSPVGSLPELALRFRRSYVAGPAAGLAFDLQEDAAGVSKVAANRVAMFRYGPRTAALAASLGIVRGASV